MDLKNLSASSGESASFFTTKKLTSRWQVTAMTIRRWRKAGKLKAHHIGGGVRFAVAEVERFERDSIA